MNKNLGFDNAQSRWPWTDPQKYCSCGVQSLHHCLLLLGINSDLSELLSVLPLHKNVGFGHESRDLNRATRVFKARPEDLNTKQLRPFRTAINRTLKKGSPVIIGSNPQKHWMVLGGFDDDGNYVWIDSADKSLTGSWSWGELAEWLGSEETDFEAIAIHPAKKAGHLRSVVPHIAGLYEPLGSDEPLAGEWGAYLDDLDSVFDYPHEDVPTLDAKIFFENNENAIVQPVIWMDGPDMESAISEAFVNYLTVADFHSLSIPACWEKHAVAHMALILRARLLQM